MRAAAYDPDERTGATVMDDEFRKLHAAAMPSALVALDDRVLAALAVRKREAAATRRLMAVAALVSLGGGMIGGSIFVPTAVEANPLTPLIPASPLATRLKSRARIGGIGCSSRSASRPIASSM
mgnify:CR=1 FL=1